MCETFPLPRGEVSTFCIVYYFLIQLPNKCFGESAPSVGRLESSGKFVGEIKLVVEIVGGGEQSRRGLKRGWNFKVFSFFSNFNDDRHQEQCQELCVIERVRVFNFSVVLFPKRCESCDAAASAPGFSLEMNFSDFKKSDNVRL